MVQGDVILMRVKAKTTAKNHGQNHGQNHKAIVHGMGTAATRHDAA
jgi:hypothetical protein